MNLHKIETDGLAIAGLENEALERWQLFKKLSKEQLLEQVFRITRDLEKTHDLAQQVLIEEDDTELMTNLSDALHYIQEAINELQDQILPF